VDQFQLDGRPYVALYKLLKLEGWCETGAAAKHTIDAGRVRVNGEVELRKRCKITAGQVVELGEESIEVVD